MDTLQENRYLNRVLAFNEEISNNTFETGLNNNDLIIGNSGCGKTGSYVIPNIQQIDSSLLVTDTKGQLSRRFKDMLIKKGYEVYTIDLVNPQKSYGFNPLAAIRRHPDGTYYDQDILTVAEILTPKMDQTEPIWDLSARSYMAFLIAYCLGAMKRSQHNMRSIIELNEKYCMKDGQLYFLDWLNAHPYSLATRKFHQIESNRTADKMHASILGFVTIALEPFCIRDYEKIFLAKETVDLRNLGRKKCVLFLNVSDTDRTQDHIINAIYAQALNLLCYEADQQEDGRLQVPVRIIMDDFAANAVIPNFDKIISIVRSRDIYISMIIQSLSQLESMYSTAEANTIINNCDHILFFGSQDLKTAELISTRTQVSPEKVAAMPRDKMYLIRSGEKGRMVDKIVPYSTVTDHVKHESA